MPYATPLGLTYDSGDFVRNLDQALGSADISGFPARRAAAQARGHYRGLGQAVYIEQSGFPPDEFAEARFDPSGTLTLLMGSQSSGQGHQTAYAQLASEKLGLPLDKIRVLQGDSAAIAFGRGTGGSRSIPVGGGALMHAADKLIAKGKRIAAHLLEAAEADIAFADGEFAIAGTDRKVTLDAVARAAFNPAQLPPEVEPGFAESGHFTHRRRPSPTASMSARSRSIRKPASCASSAIWWSMISAWSSTRCCSPARSMAASRKGSARRCSNAPCSIPTAANC